MSHFFDAIASVEVWLNDEFTLNTQSRQLIDRMDNHHVEIYCRPLILFSSPVKSEEASKPFSILLKKDFSSWLDEKSFLEAI